MQQGDYIVDRWLVRAIEQICDEQAITLRRFSDDWILELQKGQATGRIFGYKFSLNDSAAANIAQDKVGAYEMLRAANLPAVPHVLLRTKAGQLPFHNDWKQVVLKPLVGTSGHLVQGFDDLQVMQGVIEHSGVEAWAISPRLSIVKETRLIMMDDEVLLAYEKQPKPTDGLKMFNLGKGATPRKVASTSEQTQLAIAAKAALGLRLCAVDIIETGTGEQMILEVNDGIMMEYYSRQSDEYRVEAYGVYEAVVERMMAG